jgi:hypothetical protein
MMQWSPMGADFTTPKLLCDMFPVARFGNDAGIGIFHISIPPTNPLLPLTIATAACKNLFCAAAIQFESKMAAGFFPILAPVLTCCWPVPLPWFGVLPLPCTVMIGMSLTDFLFGWARVFVQIAIAAVFEKFGGRIPGFDRFGQMGSNLFGRVGGEIAKRYGEAIFQDLFKGLTANLLTTGKIELPFQIGEVNLLTGEAKVFNPTTGAPYEFRVHPGIPGMSGGTEWGQRGTAPSPAPAAGAANGLPAAT